MNDLLPCLFEIPRTQTTQSKGINRPLNSAELGLQYFSKKLQDIEEQYDKLDNLLRKLQDAHKDSKVTIEATATKSIKQCLEKDIEEVRKVSLLIKSEIEDLDGDNLSNMQKSGCGKGTAIERIRTIQTFRLKRRLRDKLSEFQTLRENIHQEYREVVERHVYILTGQPVDEETVDRLIETGDSEQIIVKAIQEQGLGQILDTLAEIQERHDDVIDVERKLLELQEIFLDMATYVDKQGDSLNNIESNVSCAIDHVNSELPALRKAKRLLRKGMCFPSCFT